MGVAGWSQAKLARLLGVNYRTLRSWTKGKPVRQEIHALRIDWLYEGLVLHFHGDIESRADAMEKRMLKGTNKIFLDDNVCGLDLKKVH